MNGTWRKGRDGIPRRKDDTLHSRVVREHCNQHLSILGGFGRSFGDARAQRCESLSAPARPVINRQVMPSFDQVSCYRRPHVSKTNKSYFHSMSSVIELLFLVEAASINNS